MRLVSPLLPVMLAALLGLASAANGPCHHTTSLAESADFYCQSEAGWAARKEVARRQYKRNLESMSHRNNGREFWQFNW